MLRRNRKYIIYSIILLLVLGLTVGFSAFQKQLLIDDSIFEVRLHEDVRISNATLSSLSESVVSNYEDFNKGKLLGSVQFPSASSYVLYKVDLTNYGNVKSGLLNITNNTSGTTFAICNSTGGNCTTNVETPVCNGSNCTLGSTKEIYVKVTSSSSGSKNIDLDFDFEPYHEVTYYNFRENTSSFKEEIMENDTYEITLTSGPEEVEVLGTASVSYNKSTGKLTISNIGSDITITAKYKVTDIAETSYTGTDPDNYVLFGDELYRIITKENVDDGYGNTENRTKIIRDASIGQYPFGVDDDGTLCGGSEDSIKFIDSLLYDTLNTTYYNSLDDSQKELVDTAYWVSEEYTSGYAVPYTSVFGLLDKYDAQYSWIKSNNQFLLYWDELGASMANCELEASCTYNNNLTTCRVGDLLNTYPVTFLKSDVLVSGGDGTRNNPYVLELASNGLLPNPTVISGRNLTINGSYQNLVTEEDKVGTVYYSTSTILNSNNYTDGDTTIPTGLSVGRYDIYYYIPAGSGYKAKSGKVVSNIIGISYIVNYTKDSTVSSIGKMTDTCITQGSSMSCTVTLPTITPAAGYENGKWYNGSNSYNPGSTYTVSSNGITLTAKAIGNTYTATFNENGATNIGSTTLSCQVTSGSTCTVTAPSITRSGFTIDGWSTDQNATSGTSAGGLITLSGNNTFYALTHKDVTITFDKNGNTAQIPHGGSTNTNETITEECTIRNSDTTCSVTSPTIVMNGFTIHGYTTGATAYYNFWRQNTEKSVSNSETWFAQTMKAAIERHLILYTNNNTSYTYNGSTVTAAVGTAPVCTIPAVHNGDTQDNSCTANISTFATITAPSGFTVLGWSAGANDRTIVYTSGQNNVSIIMNENKNFYAQSTKEAVDRTMTLYKNGNTNFTYNGTTYTDDSKEFTLCTIPAVYNGATQNVSCTASISTFATITAPTGYTQNGWGISSTATTPTYTSGQTNVIITMNSNKSYYALKTINDPATPTISGGATKIYGYQATTLTCATTTTYASGTSKYYSFGYATSDGGTPDNWTTASTSATLSISATAYRGTRYYSCRVYASDGTVTSGTATSSTSSDTAMSLVNARLFFDPNGGTRSGSANLYVRYGATSDVYTTRTGTTTGTIPTATRNGYTFAGWYTAASGGIQVINSSGTIQGSVSSWTDSSKYWIRTANGNNDTANPLYAHWVAITYTVKYNCGTGASGTAPSNQTVSTGGSITIANDEGSCTKAGYTFSNWTSPGASGTGTSNWKGWSTTDWIYYNGQYGISNNTLTLTATWTIDNPTTPTITGGTTKIYGASATTLTCATTTSYASGTSKYYSFGYATSDGGTPSNWTTASTTATLSVGASAYRGTRYYSCRVYASDGTVTSGTTTSSTASDTAMSLVNARLYFDPNGGSISGSSNLYVPYGATNIYTTRTGTTAGTVPTATKTGFTFSGWYTAASGGTLVINSSGTVQASVSSWTNASKQWLRTATGDNNTSNVLYAHYTINNPATPTITGGTTKIYGASATTLTCATTTSYASGTSKYYSFGYSSSDGGTPSNWTTASTTATLSVAKNAYYGSRYYSCRVYASDGTLTSSTVTSSTASDTAMSLVNARLYFDPNSGSISGSSNLYVPYGATNIYTTRTGTTAGTVPTATKTGFTFSGWYTAASGGTLVINSSGTVQASVSSWTNASKQWLRTATGDNNTSNVLYAHYTINNPATPTITGGATKVYGYEATTLTCATTTSYASGTSKYYSFGYATSDGGTPSNWTTASTTATLSIAKNAFLATRYYSCRVYASDGTLTSSTVTSSTASDTAMTLKRVKISFTAAQNSLGTLSGTSPLYVEYGNGSAYTSTTGTATASLPKGTGTGLVFSGWYTATTGGSQITNATPALTGTAITGWTNTSKQWVITSTSDKTLYAHYTFNDDWYTLNNKRYYYQSGVPLKGLQTINGKRYYLNTSTGELITGWQRLYDADGYYYFYFDPSSSPKGQALATSTTAGGASAFYMSWPDVDSTKSRWYSFNTDGRNIVVRATNGLTTATSAVNFYLENFTTNVITTSTNYALYNSRASNLATVQQSYPNATVTNGLGLRLETGSSSETVVFASNNAFDNCPTSFDRCAKCYYRKTSVTSYAELPKGSTSYTGLCP